MTIAEQAVAMWDALGAIGVRPSASLVVAMLRTAGLRFRTDTVRDAVRPRAAAQPHPLARAVPAAQAAPEAPPQAAPQAGGAHPGSTPGTPIPSCGVGSGSTPGTPSRDARGSQASSKILPDGQDPSLATLGITALPTVVQLAPKAPRQPRLGLVDPHHLAADTVFAALRDEVAPTLRGQTWSAWRAKQKNAVVGMLRAGRAADEIVERWADLSERRGYPVLVLAWVAEDFDRPAPAAPDRLATYGELLAAGSLPPRVATVPAAVTRQAPDPRFLAAVQELVPSYAG